MAIGEDVDVARPDVALVARFEDLFRAEIDRVHSYARARLGPSGFVHVGRLRNRGQWQLSYYGPARRTDEFLAVAVPANRDFWVYLIKSTCNRSYPKSKTK